MEAGQRLSAGFVGGGGLGDGWRGGGLDEGDFFGGEAVELVDELVDGAVGGGDVAGEVGLCGGGFCGGEIGVEFQHTLNVGDEGVATLHLSNTKRISNRQ